MDQQPSTPVIKPSEVKAPAPITAENSYCYDAGREENGDPFISVLYQNCLKANWGEVYYQGVIDGCMKKYNRNSNSVTGNSEEDCVRWYGTATSPHPFNRDKILDIQQTTVIQNASTPVDDTATKNAADESCRLYGNADGIQQKFDSIKYQACGLYPNGQKAYSDGFNIGCTQVGNTQMICQALVDSSILNTQTQPTQTQPMQAIQPTAADGNNCRNSGFEDGMNSGFNVNTWVHCDADQSMYYEGFLSGCTYYDAFKVDYCENWANGAIK